jgi:iron-sulfur cluster assembly protein
VTDVQVDVVWDPPWDPSKMSEDARPSNCMPEPWRWIGRRYDGSKLGTSPLAGFDDIGGQTMITITTAAAAKIKQLVPKEDTECGLRMRVVGGGCSGLQYQMELEGAPGANDKVFTSNGVKVFIDMKSALYLADAEITTWTA